jgi:hypothetical protein
MTLEFGLPESFLNYFGSFHLVYLFTCQKLTSSMWENVSIEKSANSHGFSMQMKGQ